MFRLEPGVSLSQELTLGTFSKGSRGLDSATFMQEPNAGTSLLLDDLSGSTKS